MSIEGGEVRCGSYPNALERVANGVDHPRGGRMWITAHPGCEFSIPGQGVHARAGSHGTLHALDSLVPLLVSGAPPHSDFTVTPRIVDAAALAAAILDIPFDRRPGENHG